MLTFLRRHASWVTAVVFGLVGPLMGLAAARLAGDVERQRAFSACAEYFAEHESAFARQVTSTTEAAYHLRSLFLVSKAVSLEQFRLFARDMLSRHHGITALEWAPATSEHYPVLYVEPLEPNRRALGLDLSAESVRRAALMRALATRQVTLTDPITLVRDHGSGRSFLALLPVFAADRTGAVLPDEKPEGFVVLVLRAGTLLGQILDEAGPRGVAGMHFQLSDIDANGTPTLLDAAPDASRDRLYGNWEFAKRLEIGGRHWELTAQPTEAYVSAYLTSSPLILGVGVVFLWELAGGLALLLVARSRDVAFRQQTQIFETALRSLTEGVVVADAAGHFVLFNETAETVLGMAPRDVPMSEWSSEYRCSTPTPSGRFRRISCRFRAPFTARWPTRTCSSATRASRKGS